MKVAVVISGQPRNFRLGFESLKEAYLANHDCDIFFHSWTDQKFKATQYHVRADESKEYDFGKYSEAELLSLYIPTKYAFEQSRVFDLTGYTDKAWRQPLNNTLSMFYSLKESFNLVPDTYDLYIRTRFDLAYDPCLLDLASLDHTKLHMYEWNVEPVSKDRGYYDVFAVGSYETMKIYSTVFDRIPYYLYDDQNYRDFTQPHSPLRNEYLLRYHLNVSGVPVQLHKPHFTTADGNVIR